jgi:hypothetical protein
MNATSLLFGECAITVDDVMDEPTVANIVHLLADATGAAANVDAETETAHDEDICHPIDDDVSLVDVERDIMDKVWAACEMVVPGIRSSAVGFGENQASIFDLGRAGCKSSTKLTHMA